MTIYVVTQVYIVEDRTKLEEDRNKLEEGSTKLEEYIPSAKTISRFYDPVQPPNVELKEKLESSWSKVNFIVRYLFVSICDTQVSTLK